MAKGILTHKEIMNTQYSLEDLLSETYNEMIQKLSKHFKIPLFDAAVYFYAVRKSLGSMGSFQLNSLLDEKLIYFADENYFKLYNTFERLNKYNFVSLEVDLTEGTHLNPKIHLDENIILEIITGENIVNNIDYSDIFSVTSFIGMLFDKREKTSISLDKFTADFKNIILKTKKKLPIYEFLQPYHFAEQVMIMVCFESKLNNRRITGEVDSNVFKNALFEDNNEKLLFLQNIMEENFQTIKNKVLKINRGSFMSSNPVIDLDHSVYLKFIGINKIRTTKFKSPEFKYLEHKKFKQRLYLNEQLSKQIDSIKHVISKKEFKRINKKFKQSNLPTGIVTLLHGVPGTGKTASVYEIAKKTKRDVLQVDISNIRDKYVGESEKKLKNIFSEYERAKDELGHVPILLFNEADSLIGQRIKTNGSVDVMNNAMQNILLEELENFEGILFATTNLIKNMDKAFDRRFLFKIQYDKPNQYNRKLIWKDKMPDINSEFLDQLSSYKLTGSEIENIVRKVLVESIKKDTHITLELFHSKCKEEINFRKKHKNKKRIETKTMGFILPYKNKQRLENNND